MNIGHGRAELAAGRAPTRRRSSASSPTGPTRTRRSIELAARIAELAPGDLNRVFFTCGGSEAVESALKLGRQYHKLTGNPGRYKVISRELAYHGTTMGALTATGIPPCARPFEPLFPGAPRAEHQPLPARGPTTPPRRSASGSSSRARRPCRRVILEPVQNSGGCFVPPEGYFQRVREICDEYGILFISDEVICSWGRLGEWFGAQRFGYEPDLITTAKGLTSSYAPMGAVIASDRVFAPFADGDDVLRPRHHVRRAPGRPPRSRWPTSTCSRARAARATCARNEGAFRAMLESLRDIPIVGDVRGMGYFWAIELVRDRATKETFTDGGVRAGCCATSSPPSSSGAG